MPDADIPYSSPPTTSGDANGSSPQPLSYTPRSTGETTRSIFDDFLRERELKEQAAAQQQEQSAGAASLPLSGGSSSPSLADGGPVAPDFSGFIGKIEKDHAEIQQQLKSMHDKQEADDQHARNVAAGLQAFADAWEVGSAKGNAIMAAIQANIATAEGWREFEREQDSGASKHDRDEDAGWREFKRNRDAGWHEFDRSETSGEREQEKEERRRNSGMSL